MGYFLKIEKFKHLMQKEINKKIKKIFYQTCMYMYM